ncbi:hypothetical protein [Streptomyces halobius]|uniref:Uncharacterized protein n=1 Tax=Streptomyces halobius TaxID=2879846 RepID=A0ABY4M9Y4_9ACTN|nr:hypothetical protein [Streptomyces halobius]UQA93151.1 hypothetical protein K9S39_16020 [Streptomyces halobius]
MFATACRVLITADPQNPSDARYWERYAELVPHLESAALMPAPLLNGAGDPHGNGGGWAQTGTRTRSRIPHPHRAAQNDTGARYHASCAVPGPMRSAGKPTSAKRYASKTSAISCACSA